MTSRIRGSTSKATPSVGERRHEKRLAAARLDAEEERHSALPRDGAGVEHGRGIDESGRNGGQVSSRAGSGPEG